MVLIECHIYGIPAHIFKEISEWAQFGLIRLKVGSEMYANRRFWMADRLPDGLKQVENERKCVLGVWRDEFSHLMST